MESKTNPEGSKEASLLTDEMIAALDKVSKLAKSKRVEWVNLLAKRLSTQIEPGEPSAEHTDTKENSQARSSHVITRNFKLIREVMNYLGLTDPDCELWHRNKVTPLVSCISSKSEEVMPGSFSGDRKHLEWKLSVFKTIERLYPIVLDDKGMAGPSAYGHDVSRLLSLTGFVPKHIGVRPLSNFKQRLEHGLENKPEQGFMRILDDFYDLLFGCLKARSIRLEDKSQSGLPLRIHGRGYKTTAFMHAVNNIDDVLRNSTDVRYLLREYDCAFSFLAGSRRSPDAAGKKRYITSISGRDQGLAGDELQDNSVTLPKVPHALSRNFVSMRYRFVWGGNAVSNAIVNTIGTSARHLYGTLFGFTFKHHGIDDIRAKLSSFVHGYDDGQFPKETDLDIIAIDVSNFDLDYPDFILDKLTSMFKGTEIHDFFRRVALAPSVQGTLDQDADESEGPIVNGDLYNFKPEAYLKSGLPSGWSWVSDGGKVMAAVIYWELVKSNLLTHEGPEDLGNFLLGKREYAVLNLGDDNLILGPPGSSSKMLEAIKNSKLFRMDLEPGSRFIGFPVHTDGFGRYSISHDPASYVTNWLTPERGIKSAFSKYWAVGLRAREHVYSDAPIIHSFRKIIMDQWKRVYGTDLSQIINENFKEQHEALAKLSSSADSDQLIGALYDALPRAVNPALANMILSDIIRDSSTLSWKWSSEDIETNFGISIENIEQRPPVWTTEVVLAKAGYEEDTSLNVNKDSYNGGFWFRPEMSPASKEFITNLIHINGLLA